MKIIKVFYLTTMVLIQLLTVYFSLVADISNILREMVQLQKQHLELEKQRFEVEKQRLEFDRVVGSQLMTLVPMVGGLLQRLVYPQVPEPNLTPSESSLAENNEADPKTDGDKIENDYDILKDSKILRTVLERGIKKYMMSDETRDSNKDDDSDNEDSGLNQSDSMVVDNDNENSCGSNK